jgi:hypothetical protein
MVSVKEDLSAYVAPSWVAPTVTRLLQSLQPTHVIGLSSIVLTESATTATVKIHRRAGQKYGPKDRLGFYRPAWSGGRPTIYLIVDNIARRGSQRNGPVVTFRREPPAHAFRALATTTSPASSEHTVAASDNTPPPTEGRHGRGAMLHGLSISPDNTITGGSPRSRRRIWSTGVPPLVNVDVTDNQATPR